MTLSPDLLPLWRELGDLKRIRSAGRPRSIATRLFAGAWGALAKADDPAAVMARTVSAALAAVRLGDLDRDTLRALGLSDAEGSAVLRRAFDEVTQPVDPALAGHLREALPNGACHGERPPDFVGALADQPRAGVTCPGRPRLVLQPAESHAEHCLIVAVYGVLAAPAYGADPVKVFVASMAHHFHNVAMPDSGYSGEVLLGDLLTRVIADAREAVLNTLEPQVAATVRRALEPIAGDETPEARAFHAGDVADRVLEIEQHFRAGHATMGEVLGTYGLVHDGPVKPFHDRVLSELGIA